MRMKVKIRKLRLSLALVAILLFTLAQVFNVTATPTNQEKAITFLRDVAGLDMAKYELTNAREFPAIMYTFTSGNNTLDVLCVFSDGELVYCFLLPKSSPLLMVQPVTDPLAAA